MNYNIYFSPTGSTQKVSTFITSHFGDYQDIDVSLSQELTLEVNEDDFCVIAVPSFGGRVPAVALSRLKTIKANQTRMLIVVTYGNRHYDDTLLELKEELEQIGFVCMGAWAIVCEHSIMHQFASGRPTKEDLQEIEEQISLLKPHDVIVPGQHPYKEYNGVPLKPQTSSKCTQCGICATKCPVQAIPVDHPDQTNKDLCISCMRCVKLCPQQARQCSSIKIKLSSQMLKKVCSVKKHNEFY